MKQDRKQIGELLKKLANSASPWRRVFQNGHFEEIDGAIAKLSPVELASLDLRARRYSGYDWEYFEPSDVGRLARSKFASSLVGLASFHFNGYVREAAVRQLALQRTGKELPFLLIRLNDWVAQVREAAAKAVRARIEPAYALHLLANIVLVLRLRVCARAEMGFVDEVCSLLKRPECKEALQTAAMSKDKNVRRFSFQLAAEADPSSGATIIRAIMKDPDGPTRRSAVHLLPRISPEELVGVVEPMLRDRFMPLRRDALWFAATKRPEIAKEPLRDALLDRHGSMRETARHFLSVAGVENARDYYAESIRTGRMPQLFAAICGLGETGMATDVPLLTPFFGSELARIRRAAVYAVGKLDVEGQLQQILNMLSDAQPAVSREAFKVLQEKAGYIAISDLEAFAFGWADFHVRRNALTLIIQADKWKKVPALLRACADNDARIAQQASMALRGWLVNYNSSFAEPTREDSQRISTALNKFEASLPNRFASEINACLKTYFP